MSKFSGKCDFYDEIEICGLDHVLNCEVYVGDSVEPLHLTCREDCIPYYPYVVITAAHDNVKKRGYIRLTSKSWIDIEEERYGHHEAYDFYREQLAEELRKAGVV